jgi:hypothetical protein
MNPCSHTPRCPSADAPDAAAALIISEHLQDCGYALLCNGCILLEGDGMLPLPTPRRGTPPAARVA